MNLSEQLIKEILRSRLLMGYDTSKTHKENIFEQDPIDLELYTNKEDKPVAPPEQLYPERCNEPADTVAWPENCKLFKGKDTQITDLYCAYHTIQGGLNNKGSAYILLPRDTKLYFYTQEEHLRRLGHLRAVWKMSKQDYDEFEASTRWMVDAKPRIVANFVWSGHTWGLFGTRRKAKEGNLLAKPYDYFYGAGYCRSNENSECVDYYKPENCKDVRDAVEKFVDEFGGYVSLGLIGVSLLTAIFCPTCYIPVAIELGLSVTFGVASAYTNFKKGNNDGAVVDLLFSFWPALKWTKMFKGFSVKGSAWNEVYDGYRKYGTGILTDPRITDEFYHTCSDDARIILHKLLRSDETARNRLFLDLVDQGTLLNRQAYLQINENMRKFIKAARKNKFPIAHGSPEYSYRIPFFQRIWVRDVAGGLGGQFAIKMALDLIYPGQNSRAIFEGIPDFVKNSERLQRMLMANLIMENVDEDSFLNLNKLKSFKPKDSSQAEKGFKDGWTIGEGGGTVFDMTTNSNGEIDITEMSYDPADEKLDDKQIIKVNKEGWFNDDLIFRAKGSKWFFDNFDDSSYRTINGEAYYKLKIIDKSSIKELIKEISNFKANPYPYIDLSYEEKINKSEIPVEDDNMRDVGKMDDKYIPFIVTNEDLSLNQNFKAITPEMVDQAHSENEVVLFDEKNKIWFMNTEITTDKQKSTEDLSKNKYYGKIPLYQVYNYNKEGYQVFYNESDKSWYYNKMFKLTN